MIIKVKPRHAYEDTRARGLGEGGGCGCRRYSLNPFANQHNKEMGGQRHAPAALPSGKTRYLLYRRLGGPLGQHRRHGKSCLYRDSITGASSQ